jgi:uncharacterized protein
MKIFAFTDIHGDLFALEEARLKAKDADLSICLGDISYFEHDIEFLTEVLETFPTPVILLHGNHEIKEDVELVCSYLKNVTFAHKQIIKKGGYSFVCYGGDGFSLVDKQFEKWGETIIKDLNPEKTIMLFHGPPHNTILDIPFENHHSGNKSLKKFVDKVNPLIVMSGHIHECEGMNGWIKETLFINPGIYGALIDLKELEKERKNLKLN